MNPMRRPPPDNQKPQRITDTLLRRWRLPALEGDKAERGEVLVIAGATQMPGSAILAGAAVLRAGAGIVKVVTAEAAALAVAAAVPELFVLGIADGGKRRKESLKAVIDLAKQADVVLIGPGLRDEEAIYHLLPQLLGVESLHALIIDASAIAIAGEFLPAHGKLRDKTILTPHAGEMATLMQVSKDEVEHDPLRMAREASKRLGSIVVLKGSETLICDAGGLAYLNTRGNVGLATAGSGDVLAGILAGLCARGAEPLQAAVLGVSVHACAGEKLAQKVGPLGYLAREILAEIPNITRFL
jgi:ADP-dependent NAD(P)H-hydrate dehydratase